MAAQGQEGLCAGVVAGLEATQEGQAMNLWKLTRWFTSSWWGYIFGPMNGRYSDEWFWRIRIVWCRIRNHPAGVVWYNPGGFEPDMICKNCGEDLG